nr:DUF2935 domain-containing protein [bacterium]
MEKNRDFVVLSLELHLFFARIMKEHSLFLEAGFTPRDAALARQADGFKQRFGGVLADAIRLGNGVITGATLRSDEIVTEFTARAERQTRCLTGIDINTRLTEMEHQLTAGDLSTVSPALVRQVGFINQTALRLLDGLIRFKERILEAVLGCDMFTMNYPLLIEHILREARLYQECITKLENGQTTCCQDMKQTEMFWNQIMMEHAMFIRGLLDPTQTQLIQAADGFAQDFACLLEQSRRINDMANGSSAALDETIKFRDFKMAGTKGIEECQIRSLILPLLADHVLREANHYIRLLQA